jgi:type 1 fimbria pilin
MMRHALTRVSRLLAVALALGALVIAGVAGAPTARAAGTGRIDGNLVDGTTGGTPLAGQTITLMHQAGSALSQAGTTLTDAHGDFHFTGLGTDASDLYAATVTFQGAPYSTDVLVPSDNAPTRVTLLAYEATSSDAQIGIGPVAVQLQSPDVAMGQIHVAELVTVVNAGQRTFVGSSNPANGKPMNLLRFALPAGATNIVPRSGFENAQVIQVDRGFATTATVPPGQTQFSFTFSFPYDGTRAVFSYKAIYPTARVLVVAPRSLHMLAPGLHATAAPSGSGSIQVWQSQAVPAGESVSVGLTDLPVPGERPNLSPVALDVLGAVLALLALAALGYALRRGTGLAPARVGAAAGGESLTAALDGPAPASLVRALAKLDQDRAAGTLEEAPYQVQRAALKAEITSRVLAVTGAADGGTEAGR